MTLDDLTAILENARHPVILLEGRRSIGTADFAAAVRTAEFLATRFPTATFRSGNASGSDQAFSAGIEKVDPRRLHVIAPYAGHRKGARVNDALYTSPEALTPPERENLAAHTAAASPDLRGLIERRGASRQLAAKAFYLMRDTLKVLGHDGNEPFPPATTALFYVDLSEPDAGGTGHTIRACRQHGVPCAFQDTWASWAPAG